MAHEKPIDDLAWPEARIGELRTHYFPPFTTPILGRRLSGYRDPVIAQADVPFASAKYPWGTISDSTLKRYENGSAGVTPAVLLALLKTYELDDAAVEKAILELMECLKKDIRKYLEDCLKEGGLITKEARKAQLEKEKSGGPRGSLL